MLQIVLVDADREYRSSLLANMPTVSKEEASFVQLEDVQAARRFLRHTPTADLIVADLWGVDPDKDGLDVFQEVKKDARGAPVMVMLKAEKDAEGLRERLYKHGARGFVVKGTMLPDQLYRSFLDCIHIDQTMVVVPPDAMRVAKQVSDHIALLKGPIGADFATVTKDTRDAQAMCLEMGLLQLRQLGKLTGQVEMCHTRIDAQTDRISSLRAGFTGMHLYDKSEEPTVPDINTQVVRKAAKEAASKRSPHKVTLTLLLAVSAVVLGLLASNGLI